MESINCCRMCLSVDNLNPIFFNPEHHEKYSEVIFEVTGVKVTPKDTLPKLMCNQCIKLTNECYKYRKKASETQNILKKRINEENCIKNDAANESDTQIDIKDLIQNEIDDNITLDNFKNQNLKIEIQKSNLNEKNIQISHKSTYESKQSSENFVITEKLSSNTKRVKRKCKKESGVEKERVECTYCHKILTSKTSLRNHYKIHTGFDVVCEHCGKKFISRRLLLMHCKAKHGYEKTDKCSYCEYRGSNAEQVKIHERLHTGERPFACEACGARFHRRSCYLQHAAIHLPDKTVQCEKCPLRFKSVTLMKIHLQRHRGPQYTYTCKVCDNVFARRRNVVRHLQRIHAAGQIDDNICRNKCV